jgi:predicted  nucleic acid-binding Zn-ribbon protein
MTGPTENETVLQQLLRIHDVDQQIAEFERQMRESRTELAGTNEQIAGLTADVARLESEMQRTRLEARAMERAVDDKRDHLSRLRARSGQVHTERQYSAAVLEFDLVQQDLRRLEDQTVEKLQALVDVEARRKEAESGLESARSEAGPRRQELEARVRQLEDEVAVLRDRRHNLAIRIEARALGMYDRIRLGRSHVALAPLTEEKVCGNCYTSVTVQQEIQIKGMKSLVCCEGCGVILYPHHLAR